MRAAARVPGVGNQRVMTQRLLASRGPARDKGRTGLDGPRQRLGPLGSLVHPDDGTPRRPGAARR